MSGSKKPEDYALKQTAPSIAGREASAVQRPPTYDLVEKMEFVYVRVVKARDLPPKPNTFINCDPYVELRIGNFRAATRIRENTSNPEWNQVFSFLPNNLQADDMEIRVRDKAAAASVIVNDDDQFIGKIVIKYKESPSRAPPDSPLAPEWTKLEGPNGTKIRGELMLSVWYGTQADEAFSDASHSDAVAASGEGVLTTRSKVYLQPKLTYLRVNVIGAQDLVPRDPNRQQPDLYVKAAVGPFVLRTKFAQKKSVNPSWNEDLMFVVALPSHENLVLTVEDRLGPNQEACLGRLSIAVNGIPQRSVPGPAGAKWYDLERVWPEGAQPVTTKKDTKFSSKIQLRVSLDTGYHVFDESTHNSSDYRAADKKLWGAAIGILELGILNAKDLSPMKKRNNRDATDAYCVAKYGPKWIRTRTVIDSFSPKWNEQYTWEVYDPCTVITIGVFDNCHLQGGDRAAGSKDSRIGKVRIRLSTLATDRVYTHSYPLIVVQQTGLKKMGEIQLAVRYRLLEPNIVRRYINMFNKYTQPILPKMHYSLPLTVSQLESLRHQANQTLALRMSRAEPPLEREVVEYMLDVGSNRWSMRKSKANFERMMAILNSFVVIWKIWDDISRWKEPSHTVFALVVFVLVVFLPGMIMPCFFLYLFVIGLLRYLGRPKHPPHMDIKLSHADKATTDELDEEFDTFPSSKQGNVLRLRYDTLRSIAGRMQTVLGDLATQAERVQSLVSWRDPRATCIFVIFCFFACVASCIISFRSAVLLLGLYVMRPPQFFPNAGPPRPQNFLRRLPARTDSMF